jgi:hypothetical protein
MANKSERRRKEQAKKKAAKAAAMLVPGFKSRYAQRRTRPAIVGQRIRMRHGEGFDAATARRPGGDLTSASAAPACLVDRFGGWATALAA